MKDVGLLFKGPMVRAILDGRKTETRRLKFPANASDRIWVKETFRWAVDRKSCSCLEFRADGSARYVLADCGGEGDFTGLAEEATPYSGGFPCPWKPSIFMPRWASRLTLEILNVERETLQAITPRAILAEGVVLRSHQDQNLGKCPVSAFDEKMYPDLRSLWAAGWDSVNGKKAPWKSNPIVNVITFRRIS
jgi:hypothetical protein